MKNLQQLIKKFAVYSMMFSLMQSPFILQVHAQESTAADTIRGVGGTIINTLSQVQNVALSAKLQAAAQKQNAAMMQQLSPSCRKADGTSCYTVAGKYFPECPLPASMSAMPQNVCSAATPDPNQISKMISYEQISKSWVNYFDQMQNVASNGSVPFGLQCLELKQKALDAQLTEMVNNLTRLQDQLNKDKETFKANNKKLLEDMNTMNDELMGAEGSGKKNLNLKSRDFAKYFSASCQSVIGEKDLANGANLGLLGIMQILSPVNKKASDYNANRAVIESDIRRDIAKLQANINAGGLEDYLNSSMSGQTEVSTIASVNVARSKQIADFNTAKSRIVSELGKIGYTPPPMDKNFSADFGEFLKDSEKFFKKQYINSCVTGEDKSGVAISADLILKSLEQRSTNNAGTARDKYKEALKNILDSDDFIDVKLAKIKALEGTYRDITVTYQNSSAQRITETPYELYMKTLTQCEKLYAQNGTTGSNGVSYQKKVERGQSLLRELKGLNDNFASDLGSRVLEQTLNCNGETKKAGGTCNFDSAKPEFCMSQANECANEVQGCFSEATKHVELRKAKMEVLAKNFNANAQALVARANLLYNQQKNAVMDMVKVVQARFPGTNFVIPEGMFITMPELKKDSFGVDLANDGNMAFMDELPKKIDLLKKVFKDQQTAANKEIADYISKQKDAMSREQDRWRSLASECKGNIDKSSSELAKMNNEGMKKQAEQDEKVGQFCRKYGAMRQNPLSACDDIKSLAETVDKASSRLTNSALKYTGQFKNVCNKYNNESSTIEDECANIDDKSPKAKRDKCEAYDRKVARLLNAENSSSSSTGRASRVSVESLCGRDSTKKTDKEFIQAAAKQLSDDDQETLKNVTSLKDLNSKLENIDGYGADFFEKIQSVGGSESICKNLASINETDSLATEKEIKDKADSDKKENEKAKSAVEAEIKTAKAKLESAAEQAKKAATVQDKLDSIDLEKNKAINDLEKKLGAIQTKLDNIDTEKNKALKKLELKKILADFKKPTPTKDELKVAELSRIGEQADESCDAQASNNNLGKNLGLFSLDAFDASVSAGKAK